jgi:hypothetical protein
MNMKYAKRFLPVFLFLSLLTVYGLTLAPGLTWANRGADGGDLMTAAATGGIPHPTGYPVYLLLARAFQFLPIGSLAFRTNLLSALAAAGASLLVYGLVSRSSQNPLAGLISAYAFGLAPLLWSQAVITEVYALQAFFVALIFYLSIFPISPDERKSDLALGLAFGLALGNHVTTILLLPVLLFSTVARRESRWQVNVRSLLGRLTWLGAGLLTYLILPLRAVSHPPVNWGNPVTLKNFGWLVSARLYQDEVFAVTLASLWERIQSAAALLINQFGIVGLTFSLLGLVLFLRPSALYRVSIWTLVVFFLFTIGYATDDSFLYFIPPLLSFSIWIGMGLDGIMKVPSRRFPKIGLAAGLAFLLYLFALAATHWPQVDASRDARAEQFGQLVMAQMPADTIVFTTGDQATFSLWYFHYALRQRADIAVIASDLLQFDWYQDTLKSTYPSLVVPGPFPFPETILFANPERPACYVEYDNGVMIRCSR